MSDWNSNIHVGYPRVKQLFLLFDRNLKNIDNLKKCNYKMLFTGILNQPL